MKHKILGAIILTLMMATGVYAVGNFAIQYPAGTDLFKVNNSGNLYVSGTIIAAAGVTSMTLGTDAIQESAIDMNTACASGSHLYVSGNDFACEANTVGWTDQNNYTSAAGFAGAVLNIAITGRSNVTATFPNNAITLDATNITSGTIADARLSSATIITGIQSNITNVNATANTKALPGTCTGSNFVQNTTTSGVQCAAVTATGDGNNYTSSVDVTGTTTKSINLAIVGRTAINATFTDIDTDTWATDKTGVLANITNVNATANLKVAKAGDTMTGNLVFTAPANITLGVNSTVGVSASSNFYVDGSGNFIVVLV